MSEGTREASGEEATMRRSANSMTRLLSAATILVIIAAAGVVAHAQGAGNPTPGLGDFLGSGEVMIDSAAATSLFLEANALYADGRYDEAVSLYETIPAAGFVNADVLYNLANAYFKSGETGKAVLAYERALRVEPDHADARANVAFVREQLADRQAPVGGALTSLGSGIWDRASSGRLAVAASILYVIAVVLAILGIARGAFAPWLIRSIVVVGIVFVIAAGTFAARTYLGRNVREAVVLASEVAVRTGPGGDFVLEFKLHEGTKVRTRESRDGWLRVSVPGTDLEGWLPENTVEAVEWRS